MVKRIGEDEVLLTKTITDADTNTTLKFFLEGKELIENLTIPTLKNTKWMSVTFKLRINATAVETKFVAGDMDFVAYVRNMNTMEVKKLNPEFRFTVPANQSFVTMELPPVGESEHYTFDLVKKGTNEPAFVSNNLDKKVSLGFGNYGTFYFFNPDFSTFIPGERIICLLSIAEETGGDNYDEIFVTPSVSEIITSWINFE
ncbi:hypothetical protein GCM10022216_00600 [Sphingobacterium kyonggiense]|uniref:Uncharacterized protein n=1 Tax=Sphingobacterium kyonggiense TaxID=714075 RepID=A0ABP7Y5R5_9SPHI